MTTSRPYPKPPPRDSYWSSYLSPLPDMTRYRQGAIVLDVGCGKGAQLARLREAGHRAIGVEVDPEAARACRRIGHTVVIASAENLQPAHIQSAGEPVEAETGLADPESVRAIETA